MKNTLLLLVLLIGQNLHSQTLEYTFKIHDINNDTIESFLLWLRIDDTTYVRPNFDLNDKALLSPGKHSIRSRLYGKLVIDTTIVLTKDCKQIVLKANYENNGIAKEFEQKAFIKTYCNKKTSTEIGLKKDGTFIKKSFFHRSLVGCYQFEKGNYFIKGNQLVLYVSKYECPCFSSQKSIKHKYIYTVAKDEIIDLGKYVGFIEKRY